MDHACGAAGRDPASVRLIVVTKSVSPEVVQALLLLGQRDLGENRVQQLVARADALGTDALETIAAAVPRWHMIGHLQRNKVRPLLEVCRVVHSVDSERLAVEIDRCAAGRGSSVDVMLEVNVAGESNKTGLAAGDAPRVTEQIMKLTHVQLRGLMTMAPLDGGPAAARNTFSDLRQLSERLRAAGAMPAASVDLSMGMSQDFEEAILEGATMVRVGSVLFEGLSHPRDEGIADA